MECLWEFFRVQSITKFFKVDNSNGVKSEPRSEGDTEDEIVFVGIVSSPEINKRSHQADPSGKSSEVPAGVKQLFADKEQNQSPRDEHGDKTESNSQKRNDANSESKAETPTGKPQSVSNSKETNIPSSNSELKDNSQNGPSDIAGNVAEQNQSLSKVKVNEQQTDKSGLDSDPGLWLAEPPKESLKSKRSRDGGLFDIAEDVVESNDVTSPVEESPILETVNMKSPIEKSPLLQKGRVYPGIRPSNDRHDVGNLSESSVSPLSSEKVRGMSHKDVSEWVRKSAVHSSGEMSSPQQQPRQRHHSKDRKRHRSGSSTSSKTPAFKTQDNDKSDSEGKPKSKGKHDIRRFLSYDASPRAKENLFRSKSTETSQESVEDCDTDTSDARKTPHKSHLHPDGVRMSKFRANLAKSPALKGKTNSSTSSTPVSKASQPSNRRVPEISNPLGSYRIPKLNSAPSESTTRDAGEAKEVEPVESIEESSKVASALSDEEEVPPCDSESDDDLLNETPAFLKRFQETSKTILGLHNKTEENMLSESQQSDDSMILDEPPISCRPSSKPVGVKATFSLDALLAEKVEHEETDRELNVMHRQLKEGIEQGGFVRIAETAVEEEEDSQELLPEHHEKLQFLQVSENTIQDLHPGESVLGRGRFPCVYSEALGPVQCGFQPSDNFLEKHLATLHPDGMSVLLTTDMLSLCFHKITSQDQLLRWIFFIMCVHPDSCVVEGCRKLVFDIIYTQLSLVDEQTQGKSWAPSVPDILRVIVNFGGDAENLLQGQTLYSDDDISEAIKPENDSNLTQNAGDNLPSRFYAENVREFLQTLAFALQARPDYSGAELNVLLVMIAKISLEKEFTNNVLLYELSVVISSILPCYSEDDWNSMMPLLCFQLSKVTSHHHNCVYVAQLFPHGKRGSSLQRRLAYLFLVHMLHPNVTVSHNQLVEFRLSNMCKLLPRLRELAVDDLYALSSAVALMDISVGNEPLRGHDKDDLQQLMELLRTLTRDVRDNVRRLDHTRVKDLMVRITSKWTVTLQTTSSKQRSMFAWAKQKSPQKMQVQRLETGASDAESEEEEDEETPMETDTAPHTTDDVDLCDSNHRTNNNPLTSEESATKGDDDKSSGAKDIDNAGCSRVGDSEIQNTNCNNSTGDVLSSDGSASVSKDVRVILDDIGPKFSSVLKQEKLSFQDTGTEDDIEVLSSGDESLPELDLTL